MSVVVDDGDTAHLAQSIKPPADAAERRKGGERGVDVGVQRERDAERGSRVAQIVDAGNLQRQPHRPAAGQRHVCRRTLGPELTRDDGQVAAANAEAPCCRTEALRHTVAARVGRTDECPRRAAGEFNERVLERRHRPIALEMVRLDVVDHGDGGLECEEGLVVLIRLDDKALVAVQERVAAPCRDPSASEARRTAAGGP